jgi:biotin carboxyl carrier protein
MTHWTLEAIAALADHAALRGIGHLSLAVEGTLLELSLGNANHPAIPHAPETHVVKAFAPGIFRPLARSAPLTGSALSPDTQLGWLEADGILFEIFAGKAGVLVAIDTGDGAILGFGSPIAQIRT